MNIFQKIKNLFNKFINSFKKAEVYNENELSKLSFGDVIWAERYDKEYQKKRFDKHHEKGPFIFLGIDDGKAIGMYCTGKKTDYFNSFQLCEDYEWIGKKNTFVVPKRIKTIEESSIQFAVCDCLNEFDKNRIKKCLTFNTHSYKDCGISKKYDMKYDVTFELGDVVSNRNNSYKYVVIGVDDRKCNLLPIQGYDRCYSNIDFNNVLIDYSKVTTMTKNKLNYVNSIPYSNMKTIMDGYIEYVNKKTRECNYPLNVGDVIRCDGKMFYVYSTEGQVANSFQIKKTKEDENIKIDNGRYIPIYDTKKDVNMTQDKYENIKSASIREMHIIKKSRNMYKMSNKHNRKKNRIGGCTPIDEEVGSIVIDKNNLTNRYIIMNVKEAKYRVASVDEILKNHEIVYSELLKDDAKITYDLLPTEFDTVMRILHGKYDSEVYDTLRIRKSR